MLACISWACVRVISTKRINNLPDREKFTVEKQRIYLFNLFIYLFIAETFLFSSEIFLNKKSKFFKVILCDKNQVR